MSMPRVPRRPDEGAYAALASAGVDSAAIRELVHGSTVATNAVLERRGARVAFVTTGGFRDILSIQRHDRHLVFELACEKPAPIVAPRDCFEVNERILSDGSVETALDLDQADRSWTDHTFNPWWGCTKVSAGWLFGKVAGGVAESAATSAPEHLQIRRCPELL